MNPEETIQINDVVAPVELKKRRWSIKPTRDENTGEEILLIFTSDFVTGEPLKKIPFIKREETAESIIQKLKSAGYDVSNLSDKAIRAQL